MVVIFTLSGLVVTEGADDPLKAKRGMIVGIYVVNGVSDTFSESQAKRVIQGANDITSREANIHLQVIGSDDKRAVAHLQTSQKPTLMDLIDVGVLTYVDKTKYDTFIILFNDTRFSIPKPFVNITCSVASVNVIYATDKTGSLHAEAKLIRFVAGSILMNNYFYGDISGPVSLPETCLCSGNQTCLSDDLSFQTTSEKASSCFKETFRKLLTNETGLDRRKEANVTYDCLFKDLNASKSRWIIVGNGIVEKGETCDCFYYDLVCKEKCVMVTPTEPPAEAKSFGTWIIIVIVIVLVIISVILCWKKKPNVP